MREEICTTCGGYGYYEVEEIHYDFEGRGYTVQMRIPCPRCGGSGVVYVGDN